MTSTDAGVVVTTDNAAHKNGQWLPAAESWASEQVSSLWTSRGVTSAKVIGQNITEVKTLASLVMRHQHRLDGTASDHQRLHSVCLHLQQPSYMNCVTDPDRQAFHQGCNRAAQSPHLLNANFSSQIPINQNANYDRNDKCNTCCIVVWPTTSCYADWSKRYHVTLVIIGRCTLERLTVQHFSIALQCWMCNIFP